MTHAPPEQGVAVTGLAVRVPGADDPEQLWRTLRDGDDVLTRFSVEDLVGWGADAADVSHPDFVPVRGLVAGSDCFDGTFFGYSDADSAVMDPQHRLCLEACWTALEDAGRAPGRPGLLTGTYLGCGPAHYVRDHVAASAVARAVGENQVEIGNAPDSLATRVAYALDLRGPALTLQTACSTSLVAVHTAARALLTHEVDQALAGAAVVTTPRRRGQRYQPGAIASPDGRCRTFDRDAAGTVFSDGVVVLVLRRLADAVRDGDRVLGTILGSAVGNDGREKTGFTAPGVAGQADTIATALGAAGLGPDDVDLVEAHGTGTALGDPTEVAALAEAYAGERPLTRPLLLTASKSVLGHLDVAAGAAGLVSMLLALRHREVPPVVGFRRPNPHLGLERGPFAVADRHQDWPDRERPRRAGVSSFGIGGTNAHVLVEEAPPVPDEPPRSGPVLLPLSAASPEALARYCRATAAALAGLDPAALGHLAFTLRAGRPRLPWRAALVASDPCSAADGFASLADEEFTPPGRGADLGPAWVFPGQGTQRWDMAREALRGDDVARGRLDEGIALVAEAGGPDLRPLADPDREADPAAIHDTAVAQPALFVVERALALALLDRGMRPALLIGHSIGEYVAAHVAGVFGAEEAVRLVITRGRAMSACAPGAMLAVADSPDAVRAELGADLEIAAVNAPALTVVAGPTAEVEALGTRLGARGVGVRRVATAHAFHSAAMNIAQGALREAFAGVHGAAPTIPIVSPTTGVLLTGDEAADPDYWARQLREPVYFADAVATGVDRGARAWMEIGPGRTLCGLLAENGLPPRSHTVAVASSPQDRTGLLEAIAHGWRHGWLDLDTALPGEGHRRVAAPTYPFARVRHWVDGPDAPRSAPADRAPEPALQAGTAPSAPEPEPEPEPRGAGHDPAPSVVELWAEVLGSPPPAPDADFFDVGGHSLAALRLIGRLREQRGVTLSLEEFFEAPTLVALEDRVAGAAPAAPDAGPADEPPPGPAHTGRATAVPRAAGPPAPRGAARGAPRPSVFFFSAQPETTTDAYDLVLGAARVGDRLGFEAIWTPERHFHRFGGLFPSPAVLGAALAASTSDIAIRAGSVVLPLHHPIRVVEDWGVVDRISDGRVGLSFATGFHPLDFVFAPEAYTGRRESFASAVEHVRELWRGAPHKGRGGAGEDVEVYPWPGGVQPELPVWITAGASDETFALAGELGTNLLTALLNLTPDGLREKLEVYRAGRARAGLDPDSGHVTLMVHTHVADSDDEARRVCERPFLSYLARHTEIVDSEARSSGASTIADASPADRDAVLRRSFARFFERSSLMGGTATIVDRLEAFAAMGVTEVAGLVDFGLADATVFDGLEGLSAAVNAADTRIRASRPAGRDGP